MKNGAQLHLNVFIGVTGNVVPYEGVVMQSRRCLISVVPRSLSLKFTSKVSPIHPLRQFYDQIVKGYGGSKLLLSILNSILCHRMVYFSVFLAEAIRLYEEDVNWPQKTKVSRRELTRALEELEYAGVIKCVHMGSENEPSFYEVISSDLINAMDVTKKARHQNRMIMDSYLFHR